MDIWSVGCLFAELLSGQTLFAGMSNDDQLRCIESLLQTSSRTVSLAANTISTAPVIECSATTTELQSASTGISASTAPLVAVDGPKSGASAVWLALLCNICCNCLDDVIRCEQETETSSNTNGNADRRTLLSSFFAECLLYSWEMRSSAQALRTHPLMS